jgi:hypothetical protein
MIPSLSPGQRFRVAQAIGLDPTISLERLKAVVGGIAPQDTLMWEKVMKALQAVNHNSVVEFERTPDISELDFGDCRYSLPDEMREPLYSVVLERESFQSKFEIPSVQSGIHVVLQCVGERGEVSWPQTLIIYVNSKQIKPGHFAFSIIDLTRFPVGSLVELRYDGSVCRSMFMARYAKFTSFSNLALQIENSSQLLDEESTDPITSLLCPITGELMKHPGRGRGCRHAECFELKEYMRMCTRTRSWLCPICRQQTLVRDLVAPRRIRRMLWELNRPTDEVCAEPEMYVNEVPPDPFINLDEYVSWVED